MLRMHRSKSQVVQGYYNGQLSHDHVQSPNNLTIPCQATFSVAVCWTCHVVLWGTNWWGHSFLRTVNSSLLTWISCRMWYFFFWRCVSPGQIKHESSMMVLYLILVKLQIIWVSAVDIIVFVVEVSMPGYLVCLAWHLMSYQYLACILTKYIKMNTWLGCHDFSYTCSISRIITQILTSSFLRPW